MITSAGVIILFVCTHMIDAAAWIRSDGALVGVPNFTPGYNGMSYINADTFIHD